MIEKTLAFAVLLLYGFALQCNAQTDTLFVNELGAIVHKQEAPYYRLITQKDSLFLIQDFDRQHQLRKNIHYTSAHAVIKEGAAIYYDEHGNKIAEGDYHHGLPIHSWNYYYQGSKHIKNNRIYAEDQGYYSTLYDSISGYKEWEGNMSKNELKDSSWIKYYFRSDSIEWRMQYLQGKKEGVQYQYYKNGLLKRKEVFHQNNMIKAFMYDESGKSITYYPAFVYPSTPVKLRKYLYRKVPCFNEVLSHRSITMTCVVHKDASISEIHFEPIDDTLCQQQLIAALKQIKKWKAALVENIPIDCPYTYTFRFYGKSD